MSQDVIIIGGGPSGSSLWIMLRKYNYNVLILDKAVFPRHAIWESLLPIVVSDYMKIIWLDDQISKCNFPEKYGATFVWGNSRTPWNIFFDKRLDSDKTQYSKEEMDEILAGDYVHSYQVNRYILDKLFIDKAKSDWVVIREGVSVKDLIIDDWKIVWVLLDTWEQLFSKFIVDASWQRAIIWSKLGLRTFNEELGFTTIYWYFKNFEFLDTFVSKHTQYIVSVDGGWVWFIYIWEWIVSIWLVSTKRNLGEGDFFDTIKNHKELAFIFTKETIQVDHLGNKSSDFYKMRDWSYFNSKIYWENYLMIGDAAWFVDPVLSWWMSLALMSGITASPYIDKFLKWGNISVFEKYQETIFKDINNYYELAKYWYGNNKSTDSWFWRAKSILGLDITNKFNKRAFTFLASGNYYTKKNLDAMNELRIWDFAYDFQDIDEITHISSNKNLSYTQIKDLLQRINTDISQEDLQKIMRQVIQYFLWELSNISKFDDNLSRIIEWIFKNTGKIVFLKFFFDGSNYTALHNYIETQWTNTTYLNIIFSYLSYIYKNDLLPKDFSIVIQVKSHFKIENCELSSWIIVNYWDKIAWKKLKDISIKEWEIYLENILLEKDDIKLLFDNYIK